MVKRYTIEEHEQRKSLMIALSKCERAVNDYGQVNMILDQNLFRSIYGLLEALESAMGLSDSCGATTNTTNSVSKLLYKYILIAMDDFITQLKIKETTLGLDNPER